MTIDPKWLHQEATRLLRDRSSQMGWMRSFEYTTHLEQYLADTGIKTHMRGEEAQAVLHQSLLAQWGDGDKFILTPNGLRVLMAAAAAMQNDVLPPIQGTDLVGPNEGLVLFPEPVRAASTGGDVRGVAAVSWAPCLVDGRTPGVLVCTWTHRSDANDEALTRGRKERDQAIEFARDHLDYLTRVDTVLASDTETNPDEVADLQTVSDQERRKARRALRAAEKPLRLPDYLLTSLQVVPFGKEYLSAASVEEADRSPIAVVDATTLQTDGKFESFGVRFAVAMWGLAKANLLTGAPADLTARDIRRFNKRGTQYIGVIGLDAAAPCTAVQKAHVGGAEGAASAYEWTLTR